MTNRSAVRGFAALRGRGPGLPASKPRSASSAELSVARNSILGYIGGYNVQVSSDRCVVDREEWQIHRDLAERFVAEGLAQIEKQRRLIQDLEGNGRDATSAQAFLATLLESHGRYERHRDRLKQEAGLEPQSKAPELEPAAQYKESED
jgi:hypothetical protein